MGFLKILLFCIFCSIPWPSIQSDLETYIVQVEPPETQISTQSSSTDLESYYHSFFPKATSISSSENEEPRMIYAYHNVMKGFAARLTAAQVKEMEKKQGFLSARPQRILSLQTTHTPSFLGLQQNMGLWKDSNYGKGVIIGVLDTGIFPDHPSFSDVGMPPPPAKWRGFCESNFTTKCDNKIIGLRSFRLSEGSPIDDDGHGTHTASTAAGAFVKGANFFGNANGTAVGVAPLAHIAIYKVCSFATCSETDFLAAMDAAIDDGVDIISASLSPFSNAPFHDDPIALGAYSAMERGILVSCSAGNNRQFDSSVANSAPWILTVGASTHDRKLKATVMLGNKEKFEGETADQQKTSNSTFIALYDAGKNASDQDAPFCRSWALTDPAIKDKIVLCRKDASSLTSSQGEHVKNAGGVGMILINNPEDGVTKSATAHVLPALDVSYEEGEKIIAYVNSTSNPIAAITFQGTIFGDKNAPIVASFSTRGPSRANPGILKPDIIGPGVNILAAWPTTVNIPNKNTNSAFNILSGTSMSCAHLSGIAALLKSAHPNWSSSAIKSAIMTTADTLNLAKNPILDETLNPANIFATGAGHVNPSSATDPGLVYDTSFEDYLPYLCGLNYTNREVGFLLQRKVNCSEVKSIPEAQLNYPSFSIRLRSTPQIYTRTVTNVGDATSTYKVEIVSPKGVAVKVKPSKLNFSMLNQRLTYQVTFSKTTNNSNTEDVVQGFLKWTSNRHSVRSPIAVVFV